MVDSLTNSLTHIGVALTFGLVIMVSIYAFGHISGAHFNPAVTIGFLIRKEISRNTAFIYIITQVIAGLAASATLLFLFGNVASLGVTLPSGTWGQAFVLEFILTFFLMIIILGSSVHGKAIKSFSGLTIGATIALEAMFGGPISGASMNPARSIGPAIVSGKLEYLWVYIFATILGAAFATLLYKFAFDRDNEG